ncbi:MAG: NAD-dependent epimerase/dehydratase family protein [Rhodospirillaceae bacterium]
MKLALVCGGGGFIGGHLVRRLKQQGYYVQAVDLVPARYAPSEAHDYRIADLRDARLAREVFRGPEGRAFDEVYQLAADMGGAGYIFTGENDADIMRNSAAVNLNCAEAAVETGAKRLFFSSSACVYPRFNQEDPVSPICSEDSVYPAQPDSEYGWEKLFAERLYQAHGRNKDLTIRIGRYHNVFGPEGAWSDGREKAPAALCRKVAEAPDGGSIDIWGDGQQTRTFLYIDDCLEGTQRLLRSRVTDPVNIGSDEMVTINELAAAIISISGKTLSVRHVAGPIGVRGRVSDNRRILDRLGWVPQVRLVDGLKPTYAWIKDQVEAAKSDPLTDRSASRVAG